MEKHHISAAVSKTADTSPTQVEQSPILFEGLESDGKTGGQEPTLKCRVKATKASHIVCDCSYLN